MKIIKSAILAACLILSVFADTGEFGVKETGAGLTGTARYYDAGSVLMNPASAGLIKANCFMAGYSRLAWGIEGSSIERGMGAYTFRRPGLGGLALNFNILNQDVSYYSKMGFTVAAEFYLFGRQMAFGMTGNWYQTGYRPSQFQGHDEGLDPIFADGTQKDAFGITLGYMANVYRELWFGVTARDINEPNLAFQDTVGYGKRPMEIQAGVFYPVDWFLRPSLDLVWRDETINEKQFMRVRAGTEMYLPRGVRVRAGYDGTGIDLGMTLRAGSLFGGLDMNYAFVYPIERDLAEVGAVSHHFGLSVWGITRRPKTVDLVAHEVSVPEPLVPGVKTQATGMVYNSGKERSEGFSVTLASQDSEGNWKMIYPVKYLDGLPPDSMLALTWPWTPKEPGNYILRMSVDDDGRNLPELNGIIDERKEDNNIALIAVEAIFAGNMEFAIDERKGWVDRVDYLVEEMPLVPVIFFDRGGTEIDSVEKEMLEIYAERLVQNPDAELVIEGFFDPSDDVACTSGAELALRRAEGVRSEMIRIDRTIESRVRIANSIDCAEPEPRIVPQGSVREPELVAEENRRAEIRVEYAEAKEIFAEYSLETGKIDAPEGIEFDERTIGILKRNDDAVLLIEGGFAESEDSVRGLARAEALREKILDTYPTLLPGKIRIVPGFDGPRVRAVFTGEGLVWSPTLSLPSIVAYQNMTPEAVNIQVTSTGFEGVKVDSSRVDIISPEGKKVRTIYSGEGLPPKSVRWDWKDEGGHLLTPDSWVFIRGLAYVGGEPLLYRSEGKEGRMKVSVRDIIRRINKLLVVQFVFDEAAPTSNFLESRLDGLAYDIIFQTKQGQSPDAQLAGHTDAMGTPAYNQQLSERRANRELTILRLYLLHHLGLSNAKELDAWLANEDASIGSKGYGAARPYSVQSISARGVPVILGDNGTPRGRTVNRRVTVEHSSDEDSDYKQE